MGVGRGHITTTSISMVISMLLLLLMVVVLVWMCQCVKYYVGILAVYVRANVCFGLLLYSAMCVCGICVENRVCACGSSYACYVFEWVAHGGGFKAVRWRFRWCDDVPPLLAQAARCGAFMCAHTVYGISVCCACGCLHANARLCVCVCEA